MWRSKKLIIVAILAAVLLVGSIGGVAFAQTGSGSTDSGKTLLERVATILGIDQQKVKDAFAQAQKEMQNERLDNYLKNLVSQGKITQPQADQYKSWLQSKPDVPAGIGPRGPGGFHGMFRGWAGPPKLPTSPTP